MDNKKLLVISDSHGDVTALKKIFEWTKERTPPKDSICAVAFLGDGLTDLMPAADSAGFFSDWKLVRGNNDFGIQVPDSAVFDFANQRFFICHGHKYNLYGGDHMLLAAASNLQADVVLSGHSHIPYHKTENGIHLINPGAIRHTRSNIGSTFAVIECTENQPIKVDFWGINEKGKISKVKVK